MDDPQEKLLLKELLFGPFNQTFGLGDMFNSFPTNLSNVMENMRRTYNNNVVEDKKLYPSPNVTKLRQLDQAFGNLISSNARDTFKYFDPKTKIEVKPLNNWQLGVTRYPIENPKSVDTASINSNWLDRGPMDILNTILHEAAHVDDMRNGRRHRGFMTDYGAADWMPHKEVLSKMQDYFPSGNALDNDLEVRANLRAGLGSMYYGTSPKDYLAPVVDAIIKNGGLTYTPMEARGIYDQVKLTDKNEVLKAIEKDLFPRERWLEPREPTWQEKLKDLFSK